MGAPALDAGTKVLSILDIAKTIYDLYDTNSDKYEEQDYKYYAKHI